LLVQPRAGEDASVQTPKTRHAQSADGTFIAYQVFGEGPINLVCVPGFISNLFWNWELPEPSLPTWAEAPAP